MNAHTDEATSGQGDEPSAFDEVRAQRWLVLLTLTRPYQFGSLWWVDEDIWKSFIEDYHQESDRSHHPGLCLQTITNFNTLSMAVPMLHGRSKPSGRCFRVYGASPERERPSCFKTFCPLPLGFFIDRRRIFKNSYKPTLSEREKKQLHRFLDQTGIMS